MAKTTGIRKRHSRTCVWQSQSDRGEADRDCNCKPTFEAAVWSARDGCKVRKSFPTLAAAKSWRVDVSKNVKDGKHAKPSRETVRAAGERWIAQAKSGEVRQRSGAPYKPKVLREYERALGRFVFPEVGHIRLSELRRRDVQNLVDELVGKGFSGSTIRNVVMPLRAICRRAIRNDEMALNPTAELDLPSDAKARDRVASAAEVAVLLAALPERDRALWGTAVYAGLRRGELRALRWQNIDDEVKVIHVEHGWDDVEGEIDPKSAKGTRTVPIVGALRLLLLEHKARTGGRGTDLVFGRTGSEPFTPSAVRARALKAWAATAVGYFLRGESPAVEFLPIGLHECRHSFVSLMHDAGFSLERIGDYVGHSSTFMVDHYRHLLEGHEAEAAARFDNYLAERTGASTGAQASVVSLDRRG